MVEAELQAEQENCGRHAWLRTSCVRVPTSNLPIHTIENGPHYWIIVKRRVYLYMLAKRDLGILSRWYGKYLKGWEHCYNIC